MLPPKKACIKPDWAIPQERESQSSSASSNQQKAERVEKLPRAVEVDLTLGSMVLATQQPDEKLNSYRMAGKDAGNSANFTCYNVMRPACRRPLVSILPVLATNRNNSCMHAAMLPCIYVCVLSHDIVGRYACLYAR